VKLKQGETRRRWLVAIKDEALGGLHKFSERRGETLRVLQILNLGH